MVFVSSVEDRLVSGQLTTRAQYTGIKDELANVEGLGLKDEQALSDVTLFSYSNQKHITASIGVAYYQAVYKNLFVHGSAGFTCYPNFIKSLESDKSTMSTQDLLSSFALQAHPVYSPGRLHLGLGIAFKIN